MQQPKPVGIMQALIDYWKGYVNFRGKTTRAGYWWIKFWGLSFWVIALLALLGGILYDSTINSDTDYGLYSSYNPVLPYIVWGVIGAWIIVKIITFLPSSALTIRRYRDAGLKDWVAWVLWIIKPVIAFFAIITGYSRIFFAVMTLGGKYVENLYFIPAIGSLLGQVAGVLITLKILHIALRLLTFVITVLKTDALSAAENGRTFSTFFFQPKQVSNDNQNPIQVDKIAVNPNQNEMNN